MRFAPSSVAFCTTSSVLSPFSAPTSKKTSVLGSRSEVCARTTCTDTPFLSARVTTAEYSLPLPSKRVTSSPSARRRTFLAWRDSESGSSTSSAMFSTKKRLGAAIPFPLRYLR